MGYFPVRYNSRVVIYEHKMFIRLATDSLQSLPIRLQNKYFFCNLLPRQFWHKRFHNEQVSFVPSFCCIYLSIRNDPCLPMSMRASLQILREWHSQSDLGHQESCKVEIFSQKQFANSLNLFPDKEVAALSLLNKKCFFFQYGSFVARGVPRFGKILPLWR